MHTSTTIQLINDLKKALVSEHGNIIRDVILFGSQAKGTSHQYSDYDIVILLEQDYNWRFEKQISQTCYRFELEKNIFTDTHLISINQLKNTIKGKDPLFANAIKNGIYAQ